jgi:hypothetical protein
LHEGAGGLVMAMGLEDLKAKAGMKLTAVSFGLIWFNYMFRWDYMCVHLVSYSFGDVDWIRPSRNWDCL